MYEQIRDEHGRADPTIQKQQFCVDETQLMISHLSLSLSLPLNLQQQLQQQKQQQQQVVAALVLSSPDPIHQ